MVLDFSVRPKMTFIGPKCLFKGPKCLFWICLRCLFIGPKSPGSNDGYVNAGKYHCNLALNPRFDDDGQANISNSHCYSSLSLHTESDTQTNAANSQINSALNTTSNYDDHVRTATSQNNSFIRSDTDDFRDAFAEQRRLINSHVPPIRREFSQASETTIGRVNNTSSFLFRPSANAQNFIPSYYNHHANQIPSSTQNVNIDNSQRVSY